ncbi:MAG: efflux RND transporter periplasmic adaptor subunit [Thermoanaerobaculia bacterium]|jgi:membrane fusion protein (multidrug efflux system)
MRISKALVPVVAIAALVLTACKKEAPPPPAPPEVKVAAVLQQDVPVYVENIGQTRGSEEVEVRARAQGFLESIDFVEGTLVKQGQLLYTIDPRELQAQLAQAQGNLASADATLVRATQDVERFRPLVEQNALPRQDLETALAQQSAAKAQVEAWRATVDTAKINLGYCKITAPITGLVGKTEVNVGNLVSSGGSTLLTSISKIDPIRVRFSISERDYLEYRKKHAAGAAKDMPIELLLADGSVHPHKGYLVFADRIVDPETGTLLLEAAFPNTEGLVRTGQYARVRFAVDVRPNAILVPQRAVAELQATYSVAVLNGSKIEMRTVKTGARVGSMWVIEEGLTAGDKVVVEGMQKVKNGMEVKATTVEATAAPAAAAPPAETASAPAKEN